jgi:hypothetical protein
MRRRQGGATVGVLASLLGSSRSGRAAGAGCGEAVRRLADAVLGAIAVYAGVLSSGALSNLLAGSHENTASWFLSVGLGRCPSSPSPRSRRCGADAEGQGSG